MGTSDKHKNNHNSTKGELTLLRSNDIDTQLDMRMITYIIHSYGSTLPPIVISYPNLIPEHTYLWN